MILLSLNDSSKKFFAAVKLVLSNVSLLGLHESAHLQLKCDATGVAVCEQIFFDKTETLGYFSSALNGLQTRYSTYHLELLSVYFVVKYFEQLLLDKHFTIYTDHKGLVLVFTSPLKLTHHIKYII